MPQDPKFVRLRDGLETVVQVDMESGWGISGRDVRQWPEDERAQKWARTMVRQGVLEAASQAEWDEVHDEVDLDDGMQHVVMHDARNLPEYEIRRRLDKKRRVLDEARAARADEPDDDDDGEPNPYRGLKKAELITEIERRNEDRDDEDAIDTSGTAKELLARLQEDDAVNGGPDDD